MTALHPISIANYLTLKPNLWRLMQRWAYLWHWYSWLWFTLFSKGIVSSSIKIHFLKLSITTRSRLSRRSGGIVHGFSPRSIIDYKVTVINLVYKLCNFVEGAIMMPCVSADVQHQFTAWKHMGYGLPVTTEVTGLWDYLAPFMQIIFSWQRRQHWVQEELCYTPG